MAIDVANETDWNTAVAAVAAAGTGTTTSINITSGFTLSSSLAQLHANNANVTVIITGNGQTIDGASAFQGIQVDGTNAPTVNISNLAIANTRALGGNGENGQNGYYSGGLAYGSGGGGGGGRGAGGGLFIGGGANVTLASVTFTGNNATGGTGGNGGSAQNTAADPVNGGNGGAGGAGNNGGASGGGGSGGTGGHTGTQGTVGTAGSGSGDGGGGGGGSGTTNSTSYTANNIGGAGNANGGTGGAGGDGVTNNGGSGGPGSDGGFGGSGGAGQGGAIYVATGGTLTILDAPISGTAVTGGSGGAPGVGQGPSSFNGSAGATGQAAGSAIFINGVRANIGVSTGTVTYANTIGGTGLTVSSVNTALNKTGSGVLALSGANTFTGNVNISAGTLSVAGTTNLGNSANDVVMFDGATFGVTSNATFAAARAFSLSGMSTIDIAGGTTSTLQGVIADGVSPGSLVKSGAGTLIISGINTYTGETIAGDGTLRLGNANALPSASPVTAATGATLDLNGFDHTFSALSGGGTVTGANATIGAGGSLSPGDGTPGSSMAIVGNLSFQAGSAYAVQVNPATASFAAVTGTATLTNATVDATFAPGSYIAKQYNILTATGGVVSTFAGITNTDLPANFSSSLSYGANDVFLDLTLNFALPNPTNSNQSNVGNALTGFFNATGGIPAVYGNLTAAGLTAASGEVGVAPQQTAFSAMGLFLGVVTDPNIAARNTPLTTASMAQPIDPDVTGSIGPSSDRTASLAHGEKPALASMYLDRWRVWAAGFGGSQTADGNAALGSNDQTAYVYGIASGVDYKVSTNVVAGIALAGTGAHFSVADGLGRGHSDMVQVGAFARYDEGPGYLTGALAYGRPDVSTERTVTISGIDKLEGDFTASAVSGRLESGYYIPTPWLVVTPFAAAEFTTIHLPGYDEQVVSGANTFALSYDSDDVTASRTELGIRTAKSFAMDDAILTLRGRMAWAHNFDTDRSATAVFQALAGASFEVNGAGQAENSLLTSTSAELVWQNGFSIGGTFDSEFSSDARSYAGKGVVRYQW